VIVVDAKAQAAAETNATQSTQISGLYETQAVNTATGNLALTIANAADATNAAQNITLAGMTLMNSQQNTQISGLYETQAVLQASIAALQTVTVFGATNVHPLSTNFGSFLDRIPTTAWTNTYAVPTNGTFQVGFRLETNTVTNILAGDYTHHVWTDVNAANTVGYYWSELVAVDATTTAIVSIATGANIVPSVNRIPNPSTSHLYTNIYFASPHYRGVRRWFVRTGGNASSAFRVYGGNGYDTRLVRNATSEESQDAQTLGGHPASEYIRKEEEGWLPCAIVSALSNDVPSTCSVFRLSVTCTPSVLYAPAVTDTSIFSSVSVMVNTGTNTFSLGTNNCYIGTNTVFGNGASAFLTRMAPYTNGWCTLIFYRPIGTNHYKVFPLDF
jgi:hypothetical protein